MYKVVTKGEENEVWATGFYGEFGKKKAQKRIDEGYFHRYMYKRDRQKTLIVLKCD